MMKALALACALASAPAFAWGPDGHAIVAEIAQRRLSNDSQREVARLLGPGVSLASVSNWADEIRNDRPETANWHFVNIPAREDAYRPERHCRTAPGGDCIVAALEREAKALAACGRDAAARREALRFAIHFIADLHQPLHTLEEEQGANGITVDLEMPPPRCVKCTARRTQDNLHATWDRTLVAYGAASWGAYVARLESDGLVAGAAESARGSVRDWAIETHRVAAEVWSWTPGDRRIGARYIERALPVVDRQLARAGVRLGRFLDDAFRLCSPP